jgi:hypothetical protein
MRKRDQIWIRVRFSGRKRPRERETRKSTAGS